MDPRVRRTQERLRSAVLQLASTTRLSQISVTDLCRAAGVTRDTFYRHAAGVAELAADALEAELAAVTSALGAEAAIGDGERMLLEHVRARSAVYRSAMEPLLAAPVRAGLERSLRQGLEQWVQRRPGIVPGAIAGDAAAVSLAVAYAAAGTVGAIEQWLHTDMADLDRAVAVILAASAEWWQL
jgi:AcrR family transcriptional regulator